MNMKIVARHIISGFIVAIVLIWLPFLFGLSGLLPLVVWVVENIPAPGLLQLGLAGIPVALLTALVSFALVRFIGRKYKSLGSDIFQGSSYLMFIWHLVGAYAGYGVIMLYLDSVFRNNLIFM